MILVMAALYAVIDWFVHLHLANPVEWDTDSTLI